jgi:DNA-directed RNA polymerase specialized sigma24 family protein
MTTECYARAYTKGYDRTVRFLCSRGARGEHASDLAQSAWARGWERIGQLRNEDLVLTWINSIALNLYRAAVQRTPKFEPLHDLPGTIGINLAALDVERILRSVCPRNRELFENCLNGATTQEMAQAQGVSNATIRLRLWRARREAGMKLQRAA